jgi:hypothetical protein
MSCPKVMPNRNAVPFSFFLGSLFDVSGNYTSMVQRVLSEKRRQRRQSPEEALNRDVAAIAGDMRKSIAAWAAGHE